MSSINIQVAFRDSFQFIIGNKYTSSYIKKFLKTIKNAGHDNPTALTYNRWNIGMNFICPLFEYTYKKNYVYLGLNANYSGVVYRKIKTSEANDIIGFWENGKFEYKNEKISSFKEWKKFQSKSVDIKTTNEISLVNDLTENFLKSNELINSYHFKKIGEYVFEKGKKICNYSGIKKTDKLSLVYAFVIEKKIMYIGKTIQGYTRPLSYLTNDVMVDVKNGILDALSNNYKVDIYVKTDDLTLVKDNLKIDICEGYEQALISIFKPAWNNHIR